MNATGNILSAFILASTCFVFSINYGDRNPEVLLVLAISLFFFSLVMLNAASRPGGALSVVFGAYFVIFLNFPAMLHVAREEFPFFSMIYRPSDISFSAILLLLFSMSSLAGQILALHSAGVINTSVQRGKFIAGARPTAILLLAVVSLTVIVAVGPSVFYTRRGGDGTGSAIAIGGSSEVVLLIVQSTRTAAFVALVAALHRFVFFGRKVGDLLILLFCLVLNGVANSPLSIPRFNLFAYILIIMHILIDVTRPAFKKLLIVIFFVGAGTVFPLASFLQRGAEDAAFEFNFWGYFATSGDLDGFQSMINVTSLVDKLGLQYGWQLLSAIFAVVPRSAWPEKGWPTGMVAAEAAGYPFVNISSPIPSELYVDFGLLGILFGGFLIGYFITAIDRAYYASSNRFDLRNLLIWSGLVGYCVILGRGPLLGIIAPIYAYFGISFAVTHFKDIQSVGARTDEYRY